MKGNSNILNFWKPWLVSKKEKRPGPHKRLKIQAQYNEFWKPQRGSAREWKETRISYSIPETLANVRECKETTLY
jgi:hypothetical protein